MGYYDYLKDMLRPLGFYELETGAGAAELEVIGAQLDEVFSELEVLSREALLCTAESYGIESYERLLPYRPAYITTEDARRALSALLLIRGGCFTQPRLQAALAGCGLRAEVCQGEGELTASVSFPYNRGIPEGFDRLKRRIEEIIPCHLAVEYVFIYTKWGELMALLRSWENAEERGLSWREMEILI